MGTTLTIRNLDEAVKQKLRMKAASHGRSMEAEAREILRLAVTTKEQPAPATAQGIVRHSVCDSVRGIWKGRGSTDEMMKELRGED